jgi:hypothetical protein
VFIGGIAPKDAAGDYITSLTKYLNIGGFIRGGAYNDQITIGDASEQLEIYSTYHAGTKIQIADGSNPGIFQAARITNTNDMPLGALEFVNPANSGADANHRKECAYISSRSVTSDSNADKDAGASLLFFTKSEAGMMTLGLQITHDRKVGIGRDAGDVSARLHIAPGTAGTPPLKLGLGVLNTTAQAGAIEYDGIHLYFTDSTGARHELSVVA